MRRIYLSFLGLGQYDKDKKINTYRPAVYELNGKKSTETEFVQVAELEIMGDSSFDAVFIVATEKSFDTHFDAIQSQLQRLDICPTPILIQEDMTPEGQWKWFEKILARIEHGDRLTLDLTHGYRSIPIVFSAAVNFLQKARGVTLEAVYYGVFEKYKKLGYAPVVDMKAFYLINEWADGVSRLIEDADARKLADVAKQTTDFQVGELNDATLVQALGSLTDTIRNVDVNHVADSAAAALEQVARKKESASETGRILLDLVIDKFAALAISEPISGYYDKAYFQIQLEIIGLLIEHKLYMQAYTVMREFIASIGLIKVPKAKTSNKKGRGRRKCYAEHFVNMVQYPESEWNTGQKAAEGNEREETQKDRDWDAMLPYYRNLEKIGAIDRLRAFARTLIQYRNGFDHAWTTSARAHMDIDEKGRSFLAQLSKTISILEENEIL